MAVINAVGNRSYHTRTTPTQQPNTLGNVRISDDQPAPDQGEIKKNPCRRRRIISVSRIRLIVLIATCFALATVLRIIQISSNFDDSLMRSHLSRLLQYSPPSGVMSKFPLVGKALATNVKSHDRKALPRLHTGLQNNADHYFQVQETETSDNSSNYVPGVITWMPHTMMCRGTFNLYLNKSRTPGAYVDDKSVPNRFTFTNEAPEVSDLNNPPEIGDRPVLLIREAFVDFRHVSVLEYVTSPRLRGAFRRIGLLVTAIPHGNTTVIVGPAQKKMDTRTWKSQVLLPNGLRLRNLQSSVDVFVHEHKCAKACKKVVTCRVKEWQLIITITSVKKNANDALLRESLERAADRGAGIQLDLPMVLRTNEVKTFRLFFSLACVAGLVRQTTLPISEHLPRERRRCSQAKGAVLLSGGPLFGTHQLDPAAWRNVAHYAARALFGQLWFETVAIGVHPRWTVSEIISRCDDPQRPVKSVQCIREHHDLNRALLMDIARHVESEFAAIGVPEREWSRVILFLSCRLGSDFAGTERGKPCEESHHAGQKILGHSGYAMFGRYHAWISSIDLDEFIVDEEVAAFDLQQAVVRNENGGSSYSEIIRYESAADRFSGIHERTGSAYVRMPWFDFRVESRLVRNLTSHIMRGKVIETVGFGDQAGMGFNRTLCYMGAHPGRSLNWGGGKVALHCSEGFGFMVHDPYLVDTTRIPLDLSRPRCGSRDQRGHPAPLRLYTYHARGLEPRFGKCEYKGQ